MIAENERSINFAKNFLFDFNLKKKTIGFLMTRALTHPKQTRSRRESNLGLLGFEAAVVANQSILKHKTYVSRST